MGTRVYLEKHDDNAVTNFSFDPTGGSAKAYYYVILQDSSDLQQVIYDVCGSTTPTPGANPLMQRNIPFTHSKFPYLYATKITSMIGVGTGNSILESNTVPSNPLIGNNPIAKFYEYFPGDPISGIGYEIGVEFGTRQYPIITDGALAPGLTSSWYVKNGTLNSFTYAPEWFRYVDYDYLPQDNTIQGQQGGMALINGGGAGMNISFNSPPWLWLPDQVIKFKWYQVPYRYITSSNSYITGGTVRNWRGRVNQNNFWLWTAGSLLYLNYNVTKYSPPTDVIETQVALPIAGKPMNGINYSRLCDIEITCLLTNRMMVNSLGFSITNPNYVAAGHNLLPNLGNGNFYYATRNKGNTVDPQNPPAWYSFPMEALFSDPDVAGGPTTMGDN